MLLTLEKDLRPLRNRVQYCTQQHRNKTQLNMERLQYTEFQESWLISLYAISHDLLPHRQYLYIFLVLILKRKNSPIYPTMFYVFNMVYVCHYVICLYLSQFSMRSNHKIQNVIFADEIPKNSFPCNKLHYLANQPAFIVCL